MAVPYGVLWPCLPRASGVVGRMVATPRLVTVYVDVVLVVAVLAGFLESALSMAGSGEAAFSMAGFLESAIHGYLWGRLLRLRRLLGVGFRNSRPGKAAQCLKCLKAQRPDNFLEEPGAAG